ncbi:MAG: hypothetical protein U9N36_01625 [Euryarchaeota archaeon]|nr:hypothetical protein [Euryarchaeota archaeon]
MAIEEMKGEFWKQKHTLRDVYNVESIGIFGSYVGGAQNKKSTPKHSPRTEYLRRLFTCEKGLRALY